MIVAALFLAALQNPLPSGTQAAATRPDSGDSAAYSTPALRALVARAATANQSPPASLRGYRATVETEVGFTLRDTLGRERTSQVEQLASDAKWKRGDAYELHVRGYRAESIGAPFSALGLMKSWTVPMLYGDELDVGLEPSQGPASRRGRAQRRDDSVRAVHPLASDRVYFYRFTGGDTVATLSTSYGVTPIVRVHVEPRVEPGGRYALFEGELDIDATHDALVRMRGRLVITGPPPKNRPLLSRVPGLVTAAYIEFVNAQVNGEYWLPSFQRTEMQASFAVVGDVRSVFRVVSRFTGIDVDALRDSASVAARPDSAADSLMARLKAPPPTHIPVRVTFASGDSLSHYVAWHAPLGEATTKVSAGDFDDLAPRAWRLDGQVRTSWMPQKLDDILRYDRIEGAYTGAALSVTRRDSISARSLRAFGGWAWEERTARGGVAATWAVRRWGLAARAERSLASTNDFTQAVSGGSPLAAMLWSVDDYDYVDRYLATAAVLRTLGAARAGFAQLELGVGEDRAEVQRLQHGLASNTPFRANRGIDEGRYVRAVALLEVRPNVTGLFLDQGLGLRLRTEMGRGELDWLRTDAVVSGRRSFGSLVLSSRVNGGVVTGSNPPPQTLYELGGNEGLPGYAYKEFGGDRAAVGRARALYQFDIGRRPRRIWRNYFVPGPGPGVTAGISAGWAEASTAAARASLARLGSRLDGTTLVPLSRPTDGVRATVDVRLTLFSGSASIGVARPIDHPGAWRLVFAIGGL